MRELIALTLTSDRQSPQNIAMAATRELEQYARKGKSPYWDVIPATEPVTKPRNATLTGGNTVEEDEKEDVPVVHKLETPRGEELVKDALSTTVTNAQDELQTILQSLVEPSRGTDSGEVVIDSIEELPSVLNDPGNVSSLLSDDDLIQAAASLGDRFGDAYRVFDLTNQQHGYPIRSWETVENIHSEYRTHSHSLYAVKLHARH